MWIRILALLAMLCAVIAVTSAAEEARLRRVYSETCWKTYKNKAIKRRTPAVKGAGNIKKCASACVATTGCKALMFDSKKKECTIYTSRGIPRWKKAKRSKVLVKIPCTNKVMTIQLDDLTPGDGHHKVFFFEGFEKSEWFLDVQPNTMLFSKQTAFQKRNNRGKILGKGKVRDDCFYIGTANGGEHEGGLAAVSTCEKGKTRAYILTPVNDYEINPFREYADKGKKRSADDHPLLKLKEAIMRSVPKTNHSVFSNDHPMSIAKRGIRQVIQLDKQPPMPPGKVIYLDLSSITDLTFANFFESVCPSNNDQMFLHIAQLYNFAQVWFLDPTLGFQVWVSMGKVILMTENMLQNPDPKRRRPSYGLMNNCNYFAKAHKDSKYWDAVFILTESDFLTNSLGGLAITGGACNLKYHCAAVKSQALDMSMLTRAIVHETAHLLGIPDVYPPAPSSKLCYSGLMRSAQFAHDWSRCGTQSMEEFLFTKPSTCVTRVNARLSKKNKRPKIRSNVVWRYNAKQSSTYNGNQAKWGAWKAVDGSFASLLDDATKANPKLASCTKTKRTKNPWIRVEVIPEYAGSPIEKIHILNRPEKFDRLKNFEVRIGDNADHTKNPLCYKRSAPLHLRNEGSMLVVHCEKVMSGKYISIQITKGPAILTVCEIFAYQTIKLPNYKSPYKCEDVLGYCRSRKSSGKCGGSSTEYSKKNCAYTCGYCKRKPWKYTPKPAKAGAAPKCGDHVDFCDKVKSKGKCGNRGNIQLCPKTCGQCGKAKMPQED